MGRRAPAPPPVPARGPLPLCHRRPDPRLSHGHSPAAPAVSWKGGSDRVERLRMVKDAWELGQIREAVAIGERAFTAFRAMLRPDDTERELANRMEALVRHCGGQSTCFPTIVGVGERAALPHAPPTARRADTGVLLVVDWGVTGPLSYKSDLTRLLTALIISSKCTGGAA